MLWVKIGKKIKAEKWNLEKTKTDFTGSIILLYWVCDLNWSLLSVYCVCLQHSSGGKHSLTRYKIMDSFCFIYDNKRKQFRKEACKDGKTVTSVKMTEN